MFPNGNIIYCYYNVSVWKRQVFFEGGTMTFSKRLINLQENRGIPKKDIYSACNISRIAYYRYEIGERFPNYETLLALADFFDVSVDYLMCRTDNPKINQ